MNQTRKEWLEMRLNAEREFLKELHEDIERAKINARRTSIKIHTIRRELGQ